MAGAGGGGADQGGEKNTYYILWLIALLTLVGGMIWYFFSNELKAAFIAVRTFEAWIMLVIVEPLGKLNISFVNGMIEELSAYLDIARSQSSKTLTLEIAEALSTGIGEYLRYPVGIMLIFIMIYTSRTHILMRCTTKHDMKSLLLDQMRLWPQIKIASKVNLLNEDLDSGPWGMALTPMQFCKKYKLIRIDLAERKGSAFGRSQEAEFKIVLNRTRAENVFAAQLGKPWQSFESMPGYRRAILAIFAGKGSRDSKVAQNLIYQIAGTAAEGKIDIRGVDELWKKHAKVSAVQKICQAHAYESTVFASMLLYAREDGVMASSDFLWVKPLDRRLWYILNNVGRQTPAVEVGGIFSHWYSELALKRPLSVPDISGAVVALEAAISDILYVADDKEREEIYKRHQAPTPPKEDAEPDSPEITQGLA